MWSDWKKIVISLAIFLLLATTVSANNSFKSVDDNHDYKNIDTNSLKLSSSDSCKVPTNLRVLYHGKAPCNVSYSRFDQKHKWKTVKYLNSS